MKRGRPSWHGHVGRKDDADYVKACTRLVVEETAPVDRPMNTWPTLCLHTCVCLKLTRGMATTERNGGPYVAFQCTGETVFTGKENR